MLSTCKCEISTVLGPVTQYHEWSRQSQAKHMDGNIIIYTSIKFTMLDQQK